MKNFADLLFEAKMLKEIPRSGYHFLGAGKESVAEHSFMTAFIGFVMARTVPDVDGPRLVYMCLVHDLPESRTGDMNYVQKKYVTANESAAVSDTVRDLPFGEFLTDLIAKFNERNTLEARLAHDADQLALILELKGLEDIGYTTPKKWILHVLTRLLTETGRELAGQIMASNRDTWWLENYIDKPD